MSERLKDHAGWAAVIIVLIIQAVFVIQKIERMATTQDISVQQQAVAADRLERVLTEINQIDRRVTRLESRTPNP